MNTSSTSNGRWLRLRERRRRSILAGAARVFAEQGYDHANIRSLAAAANVTKATVYAHFENKLDLFKAVTEHWAQLCPQPDLTCPTSAPLEVLLQEVAELIARQAEHPVAEAFAQVIQRSTQLPAEYVRAWDARYSRFAEHLSRVFGHHLPDADSAIHASQFLQLLIGYIQERAEERRNGASGRSQRYLAVAIDLFCGSNSQRATAGVVAASQPATA